MFREYMLNITPCGDHGAEYHQSEGEESHAGHRAAEPKYFTVSDKDDGQVFEDCVDGN